MATKNWYKSKTLWFSTLFILVSLASLAGFADFEPDPALVGLFEALVFAVLRFKTNRPVGPSKS